MKNDALKALYEERSDLVAKARQIMDKADNENRSMNTEETSTSERMLDRVDAIEGEIEQMNQRSRLESAENHLDSPARAVATPALGGTSSSMDATAGAEYTRSFWANLRGEATYEQRSQLKGTANVGGNVCPDDMERRIIEELQQASVMRTLANVQTVDSDRTIPVESFQGSAGWVAEAGSISASDTQFTQVSMSAYKAADRIDASVELLADGVVDLNSYFANIIGRRMGRLMEEAYWDGDGSGKPTGVVTGTTQNHETASSGAITADDLFDWEGTLPVQYRPGAAFVLSDGAVKAIRKLKDSNDRYIWEPNGWGTATADGAGGTILGYPYFICEFADAPAASAVVGVFGRWENFFIYDRAPGTTLLTDPYTNADTGMVRIISHRRTDSKVVLAEAFAKMTCAA